MVRKVWLSVYEDGTENMSCAKPRRCIDTYCNETVKYWISEVKFIPIIEIPSGTIEKLIGRTMTWDDEPVEWRGVIPKQ